MSAHYTRQNGTSGAHDLTEVGNEHDHRNVDNIRIAHFSGQNMHGNPCANT